MLCIKGSELMTIEAAQSVAGAKPHEAARVLENTMDIGTLQAVGCRVDLDRKALGVCA